MARDLTQHVPREPSALESDAAAYAAGYARTLREYEWACGYGWAPTERQLVLAHTQAMRVYGAVRGGRPIGGPRPAWLAGRADALRELLRQRASAES